MIKFSQALLVLGCTYFFNCESCLYITESLKSCTYTIESLVLSCTQYGFAEANPLKSCALQGWSAICLWSTCEQASDSSNGTSEWAFWAKPKIWLTWTGILSKASIEQLHSRVTKEHAMYISRNINLKNSLSYNSTIVSSKSMELALEIKHLFSFM